MRHQQVVESSSTPRATQARVQTPQRDATEYLRWTVISAVLAFAGIILLGLLSIIDALRGHPLASWHAFLGAWDIAWKLLALGAAAIVAYKIHKDRSHTALERAEARKINEQAKNLRTARRHNAKSMPQGYIMFADDLGNYGQIVSTTGRVPYLLPGNAPNGNAGLNKHLLDFMDRSMNNTVVDEVEPARQIAAPGVSVHLTDDYAIPADDLLSGRKLIVGQSGYGKSNTVGTLVEELGGLDVPLVLADTENEYESLCNPRWLPHGLIVDASTVTPENAYQFGGYVLQELKQIILNLQSYEMEEAALVMIGIVQGMRDWQEERDIRIPSEFILEEAVTWLPQNIKESPLYGSETLNTLQGTVFNDMVRKGRKRGLGLTVVCQKIAEIDKRALQADTKILHYQNEEPDLKRYAGMGIKTEETLSLQTGDAFLFTSHVSKRRVHIRKRYSEHGANTPGLDNLHRYQQSRKLPENASETGRNYAETFEKQAVGYENFDRPVEPFRNISAFRQTEKTAVENPYEGISEMLRKEIEEAYERRGCRDRVAIRDELQLNGDQYWMVRNVCNEYDKKRKEG